MEGFISLLEAIDGVVWGPIMLTVLVGTGVYLTIRTRFLCWRNLGHLDIELLKKLIFPTAPFTYFLKTYAISNLQQAIWKLRIAENISRSSGNNQL